MGIMYFVRHGQTVWNVENKICGATDSPLTEQGHMQAKRTGEIINDAISAGRMHIDMILTSPLSRARDTAEEISSQTGIPVHTEVRLTEQNFGRWEGTPRDGGDFAAAKQNFCDSFSGGESMLRCAQRVYDLIDEITAIPEKTFLLVAHNGIARIVESYFRDMTNAEFAAFGIKNAQIREYRF